MCVRVSETLHSLNYDIPSTSPIVRKAIDNYMDVYISLLRTREFAYDALRALVDKYNLGLVTDFAYHPAVYRILDRFALKDFFKTIVVSGEIGYKKPSSQIFEAALFRLSAKPEENGYCRGEEYGNENHTSQ
jgi:putative hydrolase of the HAD superfamily